MECYACNKYVENIYQHIQEHDNATNWTDSPDHFTLIDLSEYIPKDMAGIITSYLTSGYLWSFTPCPKCYHRHRGYHRMTPTVGGGYIHPKQAPRIHPKWIEHIQPYVLKIKNGPFSPRKHFLLKGDIINVPGIFSLKKYEKPRFPMYIATCRVGI